ncbi:MAG: Stp1/IreP family PP2C-type Ser/Thr phosphatase [Clostridiales Family XIII bacterium]|jgi:protein phosphatase|nr:Stp1/IreP family PP2C-type Ser/Thr phosphatase [Clostridiales Family XIII bacterium]
MAAFGFRTDIGRKRENNEDALLLLPRFGIFAVADGVGGQNSGEVASRKAVSGIENFLRANPLSGADNLEGKYRENWLRGYFTRCMQKVNTEIMKLAASAPEFQRMATTAVVCFLDMESAYVVNVGDSRAYILRNGVLSQLTEDHTYVNNLINAGTLTKSEARIHPKKNIITRALGAAANFEPDFYRFDLQEGDRILLCTDGLHGELTDEEIEGILNKDEDLNQICRLLVNAANEKGGGDNITVVCVDNK